MEKKIEVSSKCRSHFFKQSAIAKIATIFSARFLSIVINGESILLNESGLSKEIYALKQERITILEELGDLLDDFENNKTSKDVYQKLRSGSKEKLSHIRSQIATP